MSTDEDYVYDEDSGEWMPASELAAKQAAANRVEVRDLLNLPKGVQVVLHRRRIGLGVGALGARRQWTCRVQSGESNFPRVHVIMDKLPSIISYWETWSRDRVDGDRLSDRGSHPCRVGDHQLRRSETVGDVPRAEVGQVGIQVVHAPPFVV